MQDCVSPTLVAASSPYKLSSATQVRTYAVIELLMSLPWSDHLTRCHHCIASIPPNSPYAIHHATALVLLLWLTLVHGSGCQGEALKPPCAEINPLNRIPIMRASGSLPVSQGCFWIQSGDFAQIARITSPLTIVKREVQICQREEASHDPRHIVWGFGSLSFIYCRSNNGSLHEPRRQATGQSCSLCSSR